MVPGGFCSISIPVLLLPTLTKRAAMPMDGRQTPVCGPCVDLQIVSWHFVTSRTLEAQLHDFYPKMETALAEGLARRLGVVPASDLKVVRIYAASFSTRHAFRRPDLTSCCMISGEASSGAGDYPADAIAGFADCLSGFKPAGNADHAFFTSKTPLSMTIDEVEAIWEPIAASDDWSALHRKNRRGAGNGCWI